MGKWILVGLVVAVVVITFSLIGAHTQPPRFKAAGGTHITWTPYSPDAVRQAAAQHKPVVLDFYADWCVACHVLEETVFSDPAIVARLSGMVALRMDATKMNSPEVQAVLDDYAIIGLPTVVFLDASGKEIQPARVEGAGAEEEFARALDMVERHKT